MVRSNLDLYPEQWKKLTNITLKNQVPRNRFIRSMIELILTDESLITETLNLTKTNIRRN